MTTWFAIRKGRRRTAKDIMRFIVLPAIGTVLTGILWVNLHADALIGGIAWAVIGFAYLLFLTRGFHRPVAAFDESQPVTGFNKAV